jgi:hypothetical protein
VSIPWRTNLCDIGGLRHIAAGLRLLSAISLLPLLPAGPVIAQRPTSPTAAPLLSGLYGNVAVEVRRASGDTLHVGVADSSRSLVVILLARDVRTWADSAMRVLAVRPRTGSPARTATVAAPGHKSGSISLSRSAEASNPEANVLFADSAFHELRTRMSVSDAQAMVASLRRVAASISTPKRGR